MANALHAIAHGVRFDIPDLFIRNLAYAADSPQILKPYAPWIMFAIVQLLEKKYFCPFVLKVFMPPVRNTLQIVKDIGKGKTPIGATASASARAPKVKKVKVDIPREENPSLYEICLRTQ